MKYIRLKYKLIYMYQFLKNYQCSQKLIIDHKLMKLKKQLEELNEILLNTKDDYSREYTVIFNTILSLENIRLYKLITKNKS